MKRFFKVLLATVALVAMGSVRAQAPRAPEVAARAYLLLDVTADQVLAQKDADSPVEPGSLTKLMSAYLVFDALRSKKIELQQRVSISERAGKMPGSRMFVDPKMQVPVEDLIKGMVVQSGNDATMALAEAVGGTASHFVELMNEQAKVFGLRNTSYRNPEGQSEPGQLTTAGDLGILAARLVRDFPQYMGYYALKQYRYAGSPLSNANSRNLLLFRDPTVDGLQTGHAPTAGFCLVATARRDFPSVGSRRLLAILLGAANESARANEGQKLLNWGYTAYEGVKLFDAGQSVVTPGIWKGADNVARLGRPEAIVVAVPAGMAGRIKAQVSRSDPLVAPLTKGQAVGVLKIALGDEPLRE
ncbi:MAG: D-alanyl-D-alanine carboxypeptidase, partial [Curvibacter sp.]|nr:D-alanyl-D-alanine carboxypeptidase [Curvibacter sp.]